MNDRYFDLGNFAVNNELDADGEVALVEAYFGVGHAPAPGPPPAHEGHQRPAGGDVGRRPGRRQHARRRLRRLRRGALRPTAATTPADTRLRPPAARTPAVRPMRDHAQVVVIGGGVGGASHRLPPRRSRAAPTSLRARPGASRPAAARSTPPGSSASCAARLPLTRMMMHSVDVYRRLEAESAETGRSPGVARGRLAAPRRDAGAPRGAPPPARLGQDLRPAHGAGLAPARRTTCFPLMDPTGVLGAAWLPTDGYLDPSGLTYALLGAAKARGVERRDAASGSPTWSCEGGRIRRVVTDHGDDRRAETVVAACGMYTPEVAALAGVTVPIVPMAHQYLITKTHRRRHRRPAPAAGPRQPRLLPAGGVRPRPRRLRAGSGAVVRRRRARRLQQPAAGRGLGPLRAADGGRRAPGARRSRRPTSSSWSTAPRASPPTTSSCSARARCAGFFVAAGFCAHGIAGAGGVGPGDGRVDPRRGVRASTPGRWTSAGSARSTAAGTMPWPAPSRCTRPTTTSTTRTRSVRPAGRCAAPRPTGARRPRLRVRREERAGSAPTGSRPTRRPATPAHRPRGLGGPALEPGHRRRGARVPGRRGPLRRDQLLEDGGRPARAPRRSSNQVCANEVDRPVGSVTYTQLLQRPRRHRVRPHRHPPRPPTATCS